MLLQTKIKGCAGNLPLQLLMYILSLPFQLKQTTEKSIFLFIKQEIPFYKTTILFITFTVAKGKMLRSKI